MTTPDDLRARLHGAADSIEPGHLTLDDVRATARRRSARTRVGSVVGVVGLVAVGVVGFVATGGSDEPGTLVSADPTVPETPESTAPGDDTVASTLPEPTTPGVRAKVLRQPGVVAQPAGAGGAPEYGEWATPWRDGFIVGAQTFAPQPLPDVLPEEIAALFPPEVRELFGGDLPPTIDEATAMLSEAGLLDEVTDILAANPEASEAIYSVPVDEDGPTLDVRFTADGVTWEPIEMTLPPGATYVNSVATVGDRLVVAYPTTDPATGMNVDGVVRVATSSDLVNWDVQEIVTPPPPVTFPDGIGWSTDVVGFAANESGWVLSVYSGTNLNPEALLPADVRADLVGDDNGYGMSSDQSGIAIERTVDGQDETLRYTWEELGITPDVAAYLAEPTYEPALWAATWGGTPTPSGVGPGYGELVATSAGFLRVGEAVEFSPDGSTWTKVALPVDNVFVSGSIVVDGGVVLLVSGSPEGVELYRVDDTGGSPVLLDVPGLPPYVQAGISGSADEVIVIDASEPGPFPPPLVVDYEGYRLTIDNEDQSVEIVDLATDEVVGEANLRQFGQDADGNVVLDDAGVTVTDPTTGEVLVAIPTAALDAAGEAQNPVTDMDYTPDFWLLASRDGERFLLDDLDDSAGPNSPGVGALTSNGSTVLAQVNGAWVVYDLP